MTVQMLFVPAILSAVGDLIPICTFLLCRDVRTSVTARMVTWFACADLIGEIVVSIATAAPEVIATDPLCTLQAASNWYSVWASWAWTAAFAYAVRYCFTNAIAAYHVHRTGRLDSIELRKERSWHVACWVLPLVLTIGCVIGGLFGPRENVPVCTFRDERFALLSNLPLWGALAYNVFAYVSVHRLVHQVMDASNGLLAPDAQQAFARRVRVWPRFTVYILTFVISQLPDVFILFIQWVFAPSGPVMTAASRASYILSQLHGLLNGIVFCYANRSAYYQLWSAPRPRCSCAGIALARLRTLVSDTADEDMIDDTISSV